MTTWERQEELLEIMAQAGLLPDIHWQWAQVDGKPELVINVDGARKLGQFYGKEKEAEELIIQSGIEETLHGVVIVENIIKP